MTVTGLTIEEAAERLKFHPNSLRLWVREGRIPAVKLGKSWRITDETIDAVLRGQIEISKPIGRPKGSKNKHKKRASAPARRRRIG